MNKDLLLKEKLEEAINLEKNTGKSYYVIYSVPLDSFVLSPKMPMLGEWYSSDGIRHN